MKLSTSDEIVYIQGNGNKDIKSLERMQWQEIKSSLQEYTRNHSNLLQVGYAAYRGRR